MTRKSIAIKCVALCKIAFDFTLMALKTDAKTDCFKTPRPFVITGFAGTQIGKKLIQTADKMSKKEARSPKMTENSPNPSKTTPKQQKRLAFLQVSWPGTLILIPGYVLKLSV